ncbi:unnamed protein product [[Actinomadura] parvosata subsp. kistnae]|nr:unnamed protein product [Actinomadura parvosata subsp. kistnae]
MQHIAHDDTGCDAWILTIRFEADHRPQVEAELLIREIDVTVMGVKDSDVVISMSDAVREALIGLGWIPPGG